MKQSPGNGTIAPDDQNKNRAKQTVGLLKRAHTLTTKDYLYIMNRFKLNGASTVAHALIMKTELSTLKRRKEQLSRLRESEDENDENQSSYWNQSSKSGKRQGKNTTRSPESSTHVNTKRPRSEPEGKPDGDPQRHARPSETQKRSGWNPGTRTSKTQKRSGWNPDNARARNKTRQEVEETARR